MDEFRRVKLAKDRPLVRKLAAMICSLDPRKFLDPRERDEEGPAELYVRHGHGEL